ncbi:AAA family ATPase [Streptomyces sp. SAI-208]|uniref:AAA family ATPase n=1 Tax=Streptomyces sp. SAI-208 TaxID=2940550 RepID=UPI002474A912|nr:AAA family ATPase [Streptomyces sp. SAI-208]
MTGYQNPEYQGKAGYFDPQNGRQFMAQVETHDLNDPSIDRRSVFYFRTAFRHETEFSLSGVSSLPAPFEHARFMRTIDTDASISENYQRLIQETIESIYSEDMPDSMTRVELREHITGEVAGAVSRVLPGLNFVGVGRPLQGGVFTFQKGNSANFPFSLLSAGERATFDLIVDMTVKRRFYDNTLWCIDEPEIHLNAQAQPLLLDELMNLLPPASQMIIATHSIGFMRRAWEMYNESPGEVVFLDFEGFDFDEPVRMNPVAPSRDLWKKILQVALGDLSTLMAPEQVVLCEGKRPTGRRSEDKNAEFDARCYRVIFAEEYPTTDWMSFGNSEEVAGSVEGVGARALTLTAGTKVIRVIDRDLMTEVEAHDTRSSGVQVLSRRNIEAYLLDNEVISALCEKWGKPECASDLIAERDYEMQKKVATGADPDDFKKVRGEVYNACKRVLGVRPPGSGFHAFAIEHLAPLICPGTAIYDELRGSIFGSEAKGNR